MSRKARDRRGAKRPVLGDIIEIPVSAGVAYAQYVLNHTQPPAYGPVLRVFPGFNETPLGAYDDLLQTEERYLIFYRVGVAVRDGIAHIVGSGPIPARFRRWPLVKGAVGRDPKTGEARSSGIWNGKRDEKYFHTLPFEYYDLPLLQFQSHSTFLKKLESDWHPRDEVFRCRPDLKKAYDAWRKQLVPQISIR